MSNCIFGVFLCWTPPPVGPKIGILGQLGVEFNKEKYQKCNYSKVHWGITTKFLPVKDLKKSQLSTKFEGCSLKNDAATPLTISNFSRAWQAYFLSYTLQIWCENTTFIDVQMMCNDDFDISIGFRFEKIHVSCTVHFYSLYLTYDYWSQINRQKYCIF